MCLLCLLHTCRPRRLGYTGIWRFYTPLDLYGISIALDLLSPSLFVWLILSGHLITHFRFA